MKLAVPAVERAWADTTAQPVASPAPCYEALLPTYSLKRQNPRYGFSELHLPLSSRASMQERWTKWTFVSQPRATLLGVSVRFPVAFCHTGW